MELSIDTLKRLLGEAFDLGYHNSNEFKNDLIDELLGNLQATKIEEAYRMYKCAELWSMPEGTIFQHVTKGRCWVIVRGDGSKAMSFQKGGVVGFTNDSDPWDRPMKLLYTEKS